MISEQREMQKDILNKKKRYADNLNERRRKYYQSKNRVVENVPIYQKNFLINEDLNDMIKQLNELNG
jgi:phenylacetate-coenzyme A ligase PaaK-like adenylate-forming protein